MKSIDKTQHPAIVQDQGHNQLNHHLLQQNDETDLAYSYFKSYAELGTDRSLRKLRIKHGKLKSYQRQLAGWSSKYEWVERCKKFDEYQRHQNMSNEFDLLTKARLKLVGHLDKATDELLHIALGPDISGADNPSTDTSSKLRALEIVFERAGL